MTAAAPCLGLVYVLSGGVRAYLLSEEGREVTLFRLKPDDVCVLSASCVLRQISFALHLAAEQPCGLLVLPPLHLSGWSVPARLCARS